LEYLLIPYPGAAKNKYTFKYQYFQQHLPVYWIALLRIKHLIIPNTTSHKPPCTFKQLFDLLQLLLHFASQFLPRLPQSKTCQGTLIKGILALFDV